MPVFVDYLYSFPTVPATGSWSSILPHLSRRHPTPLLAPPMLYPSEEDVADTGTTPAQLWWSMRTTGYGTEAEMAVRWYLGSKPIAITDLVELSGYTRQRTELAMKVFRATQAGANFTHLLHRPYLELLDPSEKGSVSYMIGCGLAALSGPAALNVRLPVGTTIRRLFHASLFRTHTSLLNTAQVITTSGSEPDFIGFDMQDRIHIFEAKASFVQTQYSYIREGLRQVIQVTGIKFPHPMPGLTVPAASLNVCFAFHSSKPVFQWPIAVPPIHVHPGTRTVVVECVAPAAPPILDRDASQLMQQLQVELLGLQALGIWIATLSADYVERDGRWALHHFGTYDMRRTVAIPGGLIAEWNEVLRPMFRDVQARPRRLAERQQKLIRIIERLGHQMLVEELQSGGRNDLPAGSVPMYSWRPTDRR